ncbi:MAG: nitroreductase family protein [candidate division FCPU426 bacterium]
MNPVLDAIHQRRSVRWYENKPIPLPILETIVQAGNAAPSGNNGQPWRFVVVTDQAFRQKLAHLALPRYKHWISRASEDLQARRREIDAKVMDPVYYEAPAIIFVLGGGMSSDLDCPMACLNMMLAARSLGIGSCWVYFGQLVTDDPEIRQALEVKEGEKVFGPIVLGYPRGEFPEAPAKKAPAIKWI